VKEPTALSSNQMQKVFTAVTVHPFSPKAIISEGSSQVEMISDTQFENSIIDEEQLTQKEEKLKEIRFPIADPNTPSKALATKLNIESPKDTSAKHRRSSLYSTTSVVHSPTKKLKTE
jgi:hypothetical protein